MELDQLTGVLDNYRQAVIDSVPGALMETAAVMVSDVKGRVIHQGVNCFGMRFHPYSTRMMLVTPKSFKTGAAFNRFISEGKKQAGTKGKRGQPWYGASAWRTVNGKHVMLLDGGYKHFRELHGLQTGFKDFYWTGAMMKSVRVTHPVINGNLVSLMFGPSNLKEVQKMEGNQARENVKILMPSIDEETRSIDIFRRVIARVNLKT